MTVAPTTSNDAANLEVVRAYREAFSSFDPERYVPFLAPEPVYHAGMTMRRGQAAVHQNTGSGRVLYPYGALRTDDRRMIAEGDWVAALVDREAVTNADAYYENIYTMFYEVRDGLIATQVEILDFRVSGDKFDLDALGPELRVPGEQAVPVARAAVPAADDPSPGAAAKRTVLAFLDAFLTFEPGSFEDLLIRDPVHRVGMSKREGREAFQDIARMGRILYPHGIDGRTHHVLVSDGTTVATLVSMRAQTNRGVAYENLYGMFFDVHDGRIASMAEVLDSRIAAAAFDLDALG
jgi:ketosteroid isomerase-like protein